jgi:hypothetical protein
LAPEALPGTKRACGTQGTAALAALPAQVLTTTTTSRERMRLHRARRKKGTGFPLYLLKLPRLSAAGVRHGLLETHYVIEHLGAGPIGVIRLGRDVPLVVVSLFSRDVQGADYRPASILGPSYTLIWRSSIACRFVNAIAPNPRRSDQRSQQRRRPARST